MKKFITLIFAIVLLSCSDDNNSTSSTSINPPEWIKGYWLQQIDESTGEVTDLSGVRALNDDFYTTQLGSGNSMKALISNTLQAGGTVVVDEVITNSEYKLNVTLNGMSFPQYYYKKISSTKMQFYDTSNAPGAIFIKQ
jgi:hypothetical protein